MAAGSEPSSPKPLVGIVLGSDSDYPQMEAAAKLFEELSIPFEMIVSSAHRSPARTSAYALKASERGLKALIAGAGLSAHLAGVLAAHTTLPVIGVPLASGPLQGQDALYSTVQMPPGVPVATVGIGASQNAALLAAQILALSDSDLKTKLLDRKAAQAVKIEEKAKELEGKLKELPRFCPAPAKAFNPEPQDN
ncbi:MAG: 5-(carboxyamino)imidazole ribonucleotide mutase [Deltaproteobacteria bacterium]|jgi:phosphoribosylaminoimidazole carboxylase PurE protein|nr:5-(carboxyamino)imidazole ribonucleotide mutase [Deltaproteobacteria bacterium]